MVIFYNIHTSVQFWKVLRCTTGQTVGLVELQLNFIDLSPPHDLLLLQLPAYFTIYTPSVISRKLYIQQNFKISKNKKTDRRYKNEKYLEKKDKI